MFGLKWQWNKTYYQPWSVLEKLIHFQTLDLTKFLICSLDLHMCTFSGTTHIKMIFSFFPGIGNHFIGSTVCSSADSAMQLIHILHFFTVNSVFYKFPESKIQTRQIWRTWGPGNGFPSSRPMIRKITVQKSINTKLWIKLQWSQGLICSKLA